MSRIVLASVEARVLAVLVEKQRTVPDAYPLTLNALLAGCNQKSSREPVMSLGDAEVQQALDSLKGRTMVVETSGGRVMRYAHNLERALALPTQSVALLATLMLRGPQTAGELRINAERLHRFADISAVEAFLEELAQRPSGPLVAELPRAPGTRETRWMQLLTGDAPPSLEAHAGARSAVQGSTATAEERTAVEALARDVAALRDEVAALRTAVENLRLNRRAAEEPAADGGD